MSRRNLTIPLLFLTGLAVLAAGCGSSDDDYSPLSPINSDALALGSVQAEDFSLSALGLVNEMAGNVPNFATGDFSSWNLIKAQGDSVVWDPLQQAYTFDFESPVQLLDPASIMTLGVGIWLQYRNGQGEPLQYPLGATEMEVVYTTGLFVHMEDGQIVAELDQNTATNLLVSLPGQGTAYEIAGTGSSEVMLSRTTATSSELGQFTIGWSLDLTAEPGSCPAGSAVVNIEDYQLDATYDGLGGVSWSLEGPNYQNSGTSSLNCAAP